MLNAVVVSVLVIVVLSLLRINVIFALIAAAITAGLMGGLSLKEAVSTMIEGMSGQMETALSYVLLGMFAVMIARSNITSILLKKLISILKGKRGVLLVTIAFVASLSQNVVPVHIAFIPILIPPLLSLFNQMKIDRRAVASALTFGLQAPYIMIPAGFGLIYHGIVAKEMGKNGMPIDVSMFPKVMLIPGLGMIFGLFIALFISYRKERTYVEKENTLVLSTKNEHATTAFTGKHALTLTAILGALGVQLWMESLVLGTLTGILLMFIFRIVCWNEGDEVVQRGVVMMGFIAFVMLLASGYASVLQETGAVKGLVAASGAWLGSNKMLAAAIMLLIGLLITMGIGSSFGTVPIIATIYVPLCAELGFSSLATAALIGTAGALGDAGSPASDSTLGPTSGLNADGQHDHIWDTCVPTFLHYNIPLFIFGFIAAMVL
ncbi:MULTISPECIES: Na+/H+ antiporter family protein [Aneurinibacillus]|uniref:Na+/H+ antiporter family protein n=1 Tax=Aneurinibacillus thermoaerophilus TaxID=143495 RepID=A0ABX8YFD3_ANETH|nr:MULTISPECIES: Na+/H+ antiporter family protein [Aneurinibacillus]MED0674332.1 Na+/H+ antiporter family protein [Aneurinibacillus thermoaerophilus]MED0678351.1 Na+/H+ antiporter family protein [Aneurinibacillus thermoaerophilus]MED0736124.1 Na+/H+ antiporter family protein [Aneurinibacillus thermoaerophilus]MED0756969.1 Na+/H+ antiporter family protein [Aneurinibacillus thermoaerophilus]MED0761726.1 Na+/H+ antiporter family protein [Aneurinibacillus thermoaerophilus]